MWCLVDVFGVILKVGYLEEVYMKVGVWYGEKSFLYESLFRKIRRI